MQLLKDCPVARRRNRKWLVSTVAAISLACLAATAPENSPPSPCSATYVANFDLTIPCMAHNGQLFNFKLDFVVDKPAANSFSWKLVKRQKSQCSWEPLICSTANADLTQIKMPSMFPKTGLPGLRYWKVALHRKKDSNIWELKEIPQTLSPFSSPQEILPAFLMSGWFSGSLAPYTPPTVHDGTGKKLLAFYMVGSDLENPHGAGTADLLELIKGYGALSEKQRQQLDVVVAFGGAYKSNLTPNTKKDWRGIKFASIEQLKADATDQEFGNADAYLYQEKFANMADESTLALFLSYLKEGYQNHSIKTLIFGDHGSAYQGFGTDHEYGGDLLYLTEIDNALTSSQFGKWDLIGFDACLMGNLEVANTIRNHAKYLLASEEVEPGHGWNWTKVIKAYANYDGVVDIAKAIIDNFVSDKNHADTIRKTLSIVDLDQFNALVDKLGAFANLKLQGATKAAMINALPHTDDYGVRKSTDGKETRLSIDLKHFAQIAATSTDDTKVQQTLNEVINAVDSYVLHANNDGSRPNANGVSFATFEDSLHMFEKTGLLPPLGQYSPTLAAFRKEFFALKQADRTDPVIIKNIAPINGSDLKFTDNKSFSGEKGVIATFADDNLSIVNTAFGALTPDGSFVFITAEKAYPTTTTGQYFTPIQGFHFYGIKSAENKESDWIPVELSHQYEIEGRIYRVYSGLAEYIPSDIASLLKYDEQNQPILMKKTIPGERFYALEELEKDEILVEVKKNKAGKDNYYSPVGTQNVVNLESLQAQGKTIVLLEDSILSIVTEDGHRQPLFNKVIVDKQGNLGMSSNIQEATIEIVVDDNNTIINHSIVTTSNGRISKGRKIQPGDVIRFFTFVMLVNNDLTPNLKRAQFEPSSNYIRFTKKPEFETKPLLRDKAKEQGVKFAYTMMAEDIAENFVITKLSVHGP